MKKEIIEIQKKLRYLENLRSRYQKRYEVLTGYEKISLGVCRRNSGSEYYYIRNRQRLPISNDPKTAFKLVNEFKYLGKGSEGEVQKIKEAHQLKVLLSEIDKDIEACKLFLNKVVPLDYDAIQKQIPKIYQGNYLKGQLTNHEKAEKWLREAERLKREYGVYMPEHLTQPTCLEGKKVRSKSEAILFNHFTYLGLTFAYERPIMTKNGLRIPDFTLLSEIDYKTMVFWGHQGMMDVEGYRHHHADEINDFIESGHVPGKDIFFTYDVNGQGPDLNVVNDIIRLRIRPEL